MKVANKSQACVDYKRANDAYNMACNSWVGRNNGPDCPGNSGPDFDFGASVIIAKDKNGKDILLAGQKSGDVYGLDPDNNGAVLWHNDLFGGTPLGGVHWGTSVVNGRLFVPIADPEWKITDWEYKHKPGVAALALDDVVFAGALNGKLNAFSPGDGTLLWQYDTVRPYQTLNNVEAHGGTLDNAGLIIGNGHLVLQSGYSYINQMPGNVVLVFRVGKKP